MITNKINFRNMRHLALLLLVFAFSACIHDNFDEPSPNGTDPAIDESLVISIQDLKNRYNGADAVEVTDSVFISGVVVADDRSGNFYQTIVLEDETAGIALRIAEADYYNIYPIGRRVFVMLKGLYIGQYNGLVQMGVNDPDEDDGVERIPSLLVPNHFFPGQFNLNPQPTVLTIDELLQNRSTYQNRLIQLEGFEFIGAQLGTTIADAVNQQSVNKDIVNCDGDEILIRTSGYSDFAADTVPSGNGNVVAIFSVFGNDNQLLLRDFNDIASLTGDRCSDIPFVCDDNQTAADAASQDFENAEEFEPVDLDNWKSITVVGSAPYETREFSNNKFANVQAFGSNSPEVESWLVSPKVNFNETETLSFKSKIRYWKHDGLSVYYSNDFDGCDPATATWTEFTEAVIANLTNSPNGTGGSNTEFINSGNISLASVSGEGFIGFKYVGGLNGERTTTYQIDDIVIGEEVIIINPPADGIDEDFEGAGAVNSDIAIQGWKNIATIGAVKWIVKEFSNTKFAQIRGFNSGEDDIETYLITPQFDVDEYDNLNFDSKIGFCNHDGLTVYISTDYDGGDDPTTANWTELSPILANSSNSDCNPTGFGDFINSGDVDLSSYTGDANVAFVFRGNQNDETTTFQVDNVKIQ